MAVSSLGAGAGVLTQTVIDQLKAADTKAIITPIDNKITLQKQKDSALGLLSSLLTTFQAGVKALDDDGLYQKRAVSGATSAVSVTANPGVAVQSFSISDTVLAKKDVRESGSFANTSSPISTGSGTMTLTIAGTSFGIAYTGSTTLDDLKTAINNAAGKNVTATTLQVGTGDYRLILTSKNTGADQAISIADSSGGTLNNQLLAYDASTNTDGMQVIQGASDASFKYNGITLTRSKNSIDDIVTGMTINLLEDSGSANIAITQDTTSISDALSSFVTNYNSLTSQLTSMTTSDTTTGTVGIFNGDSTIYGITRSINQIITSINSDGLSLPQFGIDITQDGTMTFNSSTFTSKFNENAARSEKFFSGVTTTNSSGSTTSVDGVFTSMSTLMNRYSGSNGILKTLTTGSATELKALNDNKTKSQSLLDARYATMQARFVQYDTIMTQLSNSFSSLQTQISAYTNGTNN
jgi:flagellar hook-associated protein 2